MRCRVEYGYLFGTVPFERSISEQARAYRGVSEYDSDTPI